MWFLHHSLQKSASRPVKTLAAKQQKGGGECLPGESSLKTLVAQLLPDLGSPGWYFSGFQISLLREIEVGL